MNEKGTGMLAKEKWQVKTIAVLERVFEERKRQVAQYGHNEDLEDGIGPDGQWILPFGTEDAKTVQVVFREDYEQTSARNGGPGVTWMHLVREEIAEAFELSGDDPEFVTEILQVAALCVSWAEKKIPDLPTRYRGYTIQTNGDIWHREDLISRAPRSVEEAEKVIDDWLNAP